MDYDHSMMSMDPDLYSMMQPLAADILSRYGVMPGMPVDSDTLERMTDELASGGEEAVPAIARMDRDNRRFPDRRRRFRRFPRDLARLFLLSLLAQPYYPPYPPYWHY